MLTRKASNIKAASKLEPSHMKRKQKIKEKGKAAYKASRQQEMDIHITGVSVLYVTEQRVWMAE
jgi:hypothetical protein